MAHERQVVTEFAAEEALLGGRDIVLVPRKPAATTRARMPHCHKHTSSSVPQLSGTGTGSAEASVVARETWRDASPFSHTQPLADHRQWIYTPSNAPVTCGAFRPCLSPHAPPPSARSPGEAVTPPHAGALVRRPSRPSFRQTFRQTFRQPSPYGSAA
ncbi:hypothetical protein GCM10027091_79790 [Streptomyces daliensis]